MGAAAYNRGSRAIRAQIDRDLAARRTETLCPGKMRNGPEKKYTRCDLCSAIDYEKNEGDRCGRVKKT
jgi:hypothetical protein